MNPKILFISTVFPYPKDDGKKIILSSMLEYHISKYGEKNVDMLVIGGDTNFTNIVPAKFSLYNISKPKSILQIINVLKYSFILKNKSIQESLLYSKKVKKNIIQIVNDSNYDLIIFDTLRTAQYYLPNYPIEKQVVYLDDLFSVRYKKMLETLDKFPTINLNPLGNFKKFLPGKLANLMNFQVVTKALLKYEKRLVKNSELRVCRSYKKCLLISQDEVDYLDEKFEIRNVISIKPLLNKNSYNRSNKHNNEFIFLGNLSIAHNDVAVTNFIEKNISRMIQHNLKLKIIGKNPSAKLKELEREYPINIKITGYVENLEKEFSKACGMIVPLLFGTGVKLKTLEAFSYGLPIITTDYGIEGINNVSTQDYILENDITKYWEIMVGLCDEKLNNKISQSSYNFFNQYYSKENVYGEYDQIFKLGKE